MRATEQITGFFIADDWKSLRGIAQGAPHFHSEARKNTTHRGDVALFDVSDWTAMLCNDEKKFEHIDIFSSNRNELLEQKQNSNIA